MHGFRPLYIIMSWCCSVRLHNLPWNNAVLCFHPLYIYLDPVLFVYQIFHEKKKKKKKKPVFFLRIIIPWSCPVRLHNLPWNNSMLSFSPLCISCSCSVCLYHLSWNNVRYCFLPFYISWSCSVRLHHLPWNNVMHCFRPSYISWYCCNLPRKKAMPCFLYILILFCSFTSSSMKYNTLCLASFSLHLDPVLFVHSIFGETMWCNCSLPLNLLILFTSFTSSPMKRCNTFIISLGIC